LPDIDPRPLFQNFADYGDNETITKLLSTNDDWEIYKAVSLGQAPEGNGITGLTELLQKSSSPSTSKVALQMLAQEANRYPAAQEALVEQVQLNKIPDKDWEGLAKSLTGFRQYQLENPRSANPGVESDNVSSPHVSFGTHNTQTLYFKDVKNISYDEIYARLSVIDVLISVTQNAVAIQELENARQKLSQLVY